MLRVQLVSRNSEFRKSAKSALRDWEIFASASLKEGLRNLTKTGIDLLVVDSTLIRLLDARWMQRLSNDRELISGEMALVLLAPFSGPRTEEIIKLARRHTAIQDVFWHAEDEPDMMSRLSLFLHKNISYLNFRRKNALLLHENAVLASRRSDRLEVRGDYPPADQPPISFLLGDSLAIRGFRQRVNAAAAARVPVLILRDRGQEAGLLALHLHHMRHPDSSAPFVEVNFKEIETHLHEAHLFGHSAKGIPSGKGKSAISMSQNGTLLLHNIEAASWELQGKLLEFFQHRELSDEKSRRGTDIIITATNLDRQVDRGRFRQDLYYRINIFPLEIPRLSLRRGDLEPIIIEYNAWFNRRYRKDIALAPELIETLSQRNWNGEARELYALLRTLHQKSESRLDLSVLVQVESGKAEFIREKPQNQPSLFENTNSTLEEIEKAYIARVLASNPSISGAARQLGISRKTLYDKMRRFALNHQGVPVQTAADA